MPLHETPENEITALKGYSTGDLAHIIHTYVRAHEHVPCSELGLHPPPVTLLNIRLPPAERPPRLAGKTAHMVPWSVVRGPERREKTIVRVK